MAQVNIRIDDGLKEKADFLFDELGLNMTTAINMFVKQAVRQGRIPFEITTHIMHNVVENTSTSRRTNNMCVSC